MLIYKAEGSAGLREAARKGISISLDPLAALPHPDANMQRLDFSQYGIDDLGDRFQVDPHPNDPYVIVPPLLGSTGERISSILQDTDFQQRLNEALGSSSMQEDQGRLRYINACVLVTSHLVALQPDLLQDL